MLPVSVLQVARFCFVANVWVFLVWELLTYGGKPYENVSARDVPELLDKGERLPQPPIATIDIYMIMIKCWMLEPDMRPTFKELAEEFKKMAQDPGRYLVIQGDALMRLPSYTTQDEKELLRSISMPLEGPERIVDAEEYLQPSKSIGLDKQQPPPTPIKKFMDDRGFEGDSLSNGAAFTMIDNVDGWNNGREDGFNRFANNFDPNFAYRQQMHSRASSNAVFNSETLKMDKSKFFY